MKRILIVDDVPYMRQMLAKLLAAEGYEICAQAGHAREAVEKYKEMLPDLVTMDIVMPNMEDLDGIGAVREIRKFDPKAKIIVCSVMGQQAMVAEAFRAGASDFVTKPVQAAQFIQAVKNILGPAS